MPNILKIELAAHGKTSEHDEAGERALARHAACGAPDRRSGLWPGTRGWRRTVNEEKDRAERQHREAHQRHSPQFAQRRLGWVGPDHLLRLKNSFQTGQPHAGFWRGKDWMHPYSVFRRVLDKLRNRERLSS